VKVLLQPQVGHPCYGKTARIFRLAVLGPAVGFPRPGWGAGWQSSPILAILATRSAPPEALRGLLPDNAILDGKTHVTRLALPTARLIVARNSNPRRRRLQPDHCLGDCRSQDPPARRG